MPKLQVKTETDSAGADWYCLAIPRDLLDPEDIGVFERYAKGEAKESDIMSSLIGVIMKLNPLPKPKDIE